MIFKVDKNGIYVKTKEDAIVIEELKVEGKKLMSVKEFLNGVKIEELLKQKFRKE